MLRENGAKKGEDAGREEQHVHMHIHIHTHIHIRMHTHLCLLIYAVSYVCCIPSRCIQPGGKFEWTGDPPSASTFSAMNIMTNLKGLQIFGCAKILDPEISTTSTNMVLILGIVWNCGCNDLNRRLKSYRELLAKSWILGSKIWDSTTTESENLWQQ